MAERRRRPGGVLADTLKAVHRFVLLLLVLFGCLPAFVPAAQNDTTVASVVWRGDYEAARQQAVLARKPLFVLFQCPQVKVSGALDRRIAADPALSALLTERFVAVRFSTLKGVDLDTFRFDYDLQAAALILNPATGETLARWGSHDAGGGDLAARLLAALAEYHPPDNAAAAAVSPLHSPRTITDQFPRFAASRRAQEVCYHCHYAHDARFAQARAEGRFLQAMLYLYPPPENIGVTLDPAAGNVVRRVLPSSPAAKAGVRAGDTIERANGTRVYSAADLEWVLNAVPDRGHLTLRLTRSGALSAVTLALPSGWRESDISWRASQGGVPPFIGTWETPLTPREKAPLGIAADRLALRVTTLFSGDVWKMAQSDLRKGDVIVAVGSNTTLPALSPQQFHTYIRLHYKVGDMLPLTVLRENQQKRVSVPCVEVSL